VWQDVKNAPEAGLKYAVYFVVQAQIRALLASDPGLLHDVMSEWWIAGVMFQVPSSFGVLVTAPSTRMPTWTECTPL